MGKRGTALLVILCLTVLTSLSSPKYAFADDGFLGGLQDLVGVREVSEQHEFETEYLEEYVPVYSEPSVTLGDSRVNSELTVDEGIRQVVTQANTVTGSSSTGYSLLEMAARFFGGRVGSMSNSMRNLLVVPAIGLVFMWWGVRKTLDVILSAYRRGRLKL